MPTPGFPDWVYVGAVVQGRASPHPRFAITRIEFRPSLMPVSQSGSYTFALSPVVEDHSGVAPPSVLRAESYEYDNIDLAALLAEFLWTGEVLDENENFSSTGTTMPVSLHTRALRPTEELHIVGTHDPQLDGIYTISRVQSELRGMGGNARLHDRLHLTLDRGRLIDLFPEPEPSPNLDNLIDRLQENVSVLRDLREEVPADRRGELDHLLDEGVPEVSFDEFEDDGPYDHGDFLEENDLPPDDPPLPVQDGELPMVAPGQIWLLPQPNAGLWRTSMGRLGADVRRPLPHLRHERDLTMTGHGAVALTHTREADRVMRTTCTWLMEHGIRQEPPDPRANRPGQQVVIGQIWAITRGSSAARVHSRWRVSAINERAERIVLMAEDGTGKRLYWTQAQLLSTGAYVGDGLPRRTAFERILEDDDKDGSL